MSTDLQRDLAEAIVINAKKPRYKRKNKRDTLLSVGYSEKVATHKAGEILESKGVKQALAEYGLTEELITTALVDDIQHKKGKRLGELSLGADILKMKENPQGGSKTLILVVSGQTATRYGRVPTNGITSDSRP